MVIDKNKTKQEIAVSLMEDSESHGSDPIVAFTGFDHHQTGEKLTT